MKTFASILIAAAALAATPAVAPAAVREFEGTVVSVNRDARTFRLHDSERGTKRIKVTSNTRFERVARGGGAPRGEGPQGGRGGRPARRGSPASPASARA